MKRIILRLTGSSLAVFGSISVTLLLFLFTSSSPGSSLYYFVTGPFQNIHHFGNMLAEASTLIITGLGVILAFRTGIYNLGGEGQVYAGAVAALAVCLSIPKAPGFAGIAAAVIAGAAAGILLASVSSLLKISLNMDILITSFLLSNAVIPLMDYLIAHPLRDIESYLMTTQPIARQFWLPQILAPSNLTTDIFLSLALIIAAAFFLFRMKPGYEMRMYGMNPDFARYGGISAVSCTVLSMVLSGGLHGIAGSLLVLGRNHMGIQGFHAGFGWNGIAVALIAKTNPLFTLPAALFFAYIETGASTAMIYSDFTFELQSIIQGIIFFFITARALTLTLSGRKK